MTSIGPLTAVSSTATTLVPAGVIDPDLIALGINEMRLMRTIKAASIFVRRDCVAR